MILKSSLNCNSSTQRGYPVEILLLSIILNDDFISFFVTLNNIMEDEESKKGEQKLWDLKVLEISIEKDLQDLENGLHQGKESSK